MWEWDLFISYLCRASLAELVKCIGLKIRRGNPSQVRILELAQHNDLGTGKIYNMRIQKGNAIKVTGTG